MVVGCIERPFFSLLCFHSGFMVLPVVILKFKKCKYQKPKQNGLVFQQGSHHYSYGECFNALPQVHKDTGSFQKKAPVGVALSD